MKRLLLALALVALVALAGCTEVQENVQRDQSAGNTTMEQVAGVPDPGGTSEGNGVFRFTDTEAGVTCWLYTKDINQGGEGGLTCLPTNQTALGEVP